jgi:hypothetical protein
MSSLGNKAAVGAASFGIGLGATAANSDIEMWTMI